MSVPKSKLVVNMSALIWMAWVPLSLLGCRSCRSSLAALPLCRRYTNSSCVIFCTPGGEEEEGGGGGGGGGGGPRPRGGGGGGGGGGGVRGLGRGRWLDMGQRPSSKQDWHCRS